MSDFTTETKNETNRTETNDWLERTKSRANLLFEAYRLELSRLRWANLIFVVLPAVLTTAAAIFAAGNWNFFNSNLSSSHVASFMAGLAAVLMAVHKAPKCDEYQAECLRLMQEYQAIAWSAESALSGPADKDAHENLTKDLRALAKNTKGRLPTRIIRKAEKKMKFPLLTPANPGQA